MANGGVKGKGLVGALWLADPSLIFSAKMASKQACDGVSGGVKVQQVL